MNVLIVDDDYVDREHIKRTLGKSIETCVFTETESVDEAITAFRDNPFDIVLLDYRMPQRDGIELVLELRNEHANKGVAIIMLSNSEDEELALDCVRAGAHDFLPKNEITSSRMRRAVLQAQTRFELEQKLYQSYRDAKKLAEHDSLTGLANRYLFEETMKVSVANNQRNQFKLAMLLIDLDHFKYINDTHGHDIGDLLLTSLVDRINGSLRGHELFARLGGDEFAIMLSNIQNEEHVGNVARRILDSLEKPFLISGIEITIGASIGIAVHPDNSKHGDELLKFADIAMYRAKKLGRNRIVFFEDSMQQQFLQRYDIENRLRSAISQKEMMLFYQPVYEPVSARLTGFEALIRWQRDDEHMLSPDLFIGIAEESGQMIAIGRWVIEQAIQQLQEWPGTNELPLSMSINLSVTQFKDKGLLEHISNCLERYNISAKRIEFEITETAFIENVQNHVDLLLKIRALGCRISLDDFGTGYSSVSHLHMFPISTVKIDKSLMMSPKNEKTLALIRGLTAMIRTLGIEILAEGIETGESLQLCRELEIERVQGFYFSLPLPRETINAGFLPAAELKSIR